MTTVGIIANPASGQDVRRLRTHASVIGNDEKVRIVRRVLVGLEAAGVDRVLIMPDAYGIGRRALEGRPLEVAAEVLDMPVRFDSDDSRRAAEQMVAAGAGCLVTLGGDGTNRVVARGCGTVPLMPISTGTNNVFPRMTEATTAGLAAGLAARGLADGAVTTAPCIDVFYSTADPTQPLDPTAEPDDLALIDAAVYAEWYIGARAVTDVARVVALVLTHVEPGVIGLAAIGAHLTGGDRPPSHGLYLRLGPTGQPVTAPVASGVIRTVHVAEQRFLAPGESVTVTHTEPWVLALDGERERVFRAGELVRLRFNPNGPRVVDPSRAIAAAVRAGVFQGAAAEARG